MKGKRLFVILWGICLVCFLLGQPAISAEQKALKIGGLYCLTGFGSGSETYVAQGSKLGEEWINEKGGLNIKGQKIPVELVVEDMKGTPDGTVAAATKLAYDHKVKFVMGCVVPYMVQASGTVLEPAKILRVLSYNCGIPEEYGPHTPYAFLGNDGTIEGMLSSLDYLKERYPKVKSVTFIMCDDGSIPYLEKIFRNKASALGIRVAAIEKWALSTEDFTPVITKVLASKPDAIASTNGWPQVTGSILKISREMGFKGPIFGGNYDDAYQIREIAGKENSTDFFIHQLDLGSPEMTPIIKEIMKRAKAKYGKVIGFHPFGFIPWYVLKQVFEEAQSIDPTVVRDKWGKMKTVDTIFGPGKMGGLKTYGINHTVCCPCPIVSLMNGEVKWVKWVDVYSP